MAGDIHTGLGNRLKPLDKNETAAKTSNLSEMLTAASKLGDRVMFPTGGDPSIGAAVEMVCG